jgi:broad specificity phosphatase PhoE
MLIYLIRHGDRLQEMGDPGLTKIGKQQANKVAAYLKDKKIDIVYSSPLLRTKQTAEIITKHIGVPLEFDELLRERVNWGDDSNQSYDEIISEWMRCTFDRKYMPSVGDSSVGCGKRIEKLVEQIQNKNFDNVVFVTHGGSILDYLRNVFGDEYLVEFTGKDILELQQMVGVCSISILQVDKDSKILLSFGLTSHLE